MKTSSKRFLLFSFLLLIVLFFAVKYRGEIHPRPMLSKIIWKLDPYHEIRTTLFGDPQKELLEFRLIHQEDWKTFPVEEKNTNYFREKWKFRAASISENNGKALVEDVDKDGIPDVFIASGSTKVYRLNGVNGERVWDYSLSHGVTSTLAYTLADVDNDGMKEIIFGSALSHPIRVYALRTGKNEKNRLHWKRNLSGDFVQGGLNFFRNSSGDIRIVAATRDAPYSRGSINILDGFGDRVVQEISGFDVCNNRPIFRDFNNDGELDILTGSHGFYGAKYAESLTAIDSKNGEIIWSTPTGADTGWVNFPILDIDGDSEKEILVPKITQDYSDLLIFDTKGHQKAELKGIGGYLASFPDSRGNISILYRGTGNFHQKGYSQNMGTGKQGYELPLDVSKLGPDEDTTHSIVSVLDLDDDNIPEILAAFRIDNVLTLLVINAYTGKLKSIYPLNSKEAVKWKILDAKLSNLFKNRIKNFGSIINALPNNETIFRDYKNAQKALPSMKLKKLNAFVDTAKKTLIAARFELGRIQKLINEKATPKSSLDMAEDKVLKAEQSLTASRHKLKDALKKEMFAFLRNFDSITLLKVIFNISSSIFYENQIFTILHEKGVRDNMFADLEAEEVFEDIIIHTLLERGAGQGIKDGILVDLDADGYWEILGMGNLNLDTKWGVSDPEKGYYTAYDLPFPVLKGHDTNNLDTAVMKNLFKSREVNSRLPEKPSAPDI